LIGKYCRSGAAMAELSFLLNDDMQAIQVGPTEATLFDFEKICTFKLSEVSAHTAFSGTHVGGESQLTGIYGAVGPRVFQQHGVGKLGADRKILVGEDEIGNHRESEPRGRICANEFDVAACIF
ncbi:MAG: hypothetical protein ABI612_18130, partial [Betaproteobacteria bacterium]